MTTTTKCPYTLSKKEQRYYIYELLSEAMREDDFDLIDECEVELKKLF